MPHFTYNTLSSTLGNNKLIELPDFSAMYYDALNKLTLSYDLIELTEFSEMLLMHNFTQKQSKITSLPKMCYAKAPDKDQMGGGLDYFICFTQSKFKCIIDTNKICSNQILNRRFI